MTRRTRYLAAGLAIGLLAAACSGGAVDESFSNQSGGLNAGGFEATTTAPAPETTAAAATEAFGDAARSQGAFPSVTERKVIYSASLELVTKDTDAAFDAINALVQRAGGYVARATQTPFRDDIDEPLITMEVRLPGDALTGTLAQIEGLVDEMRSKSIDSQDVTVEFADIEAQLRNLTALETELRELLKEVRDNPGADPQKLLQVFESIRSNRGEIELLQGRQNLLTNLVSLATVSITITPSVEIVPIVAEDGWRPAEVARDALRRTVVAFQAFADGLITFGLLVLPQLIALAIPVLLVRWGYRRWRSRHPKPTAPVIDSTG